MWDGARVRETEERIRLQGMRSYVVAARQDATGELSGFTQVETNPAEPARGFQGVTAVLRAHRGHRLGLALKLAMLDLLTASEPQLERLFTSSSAANDHMIAINEALGYRVLGRPDRFWQLPLEKLGQPQRTQS
jgi:RimJ/RimL family protein N-acetyltransferase